MTVTSIGLISSTGIICAPPRISEVELRVALLDHIGDLDRLSKRRLSPLLALFIMYDAFCMHVEGSGLGWLSCFGLPVSF